MNKRKRKSKWYLLIRREERQIVYLYEPLKKYELNSRLRDGWRRCSERKKLKKVIKNSEKTLV